MTTEQERLAGRANATIDAVEWIVFWTAIAYLFIIAFRFFVAMPARSKVAVLGAITCFVLFFALHESPSPENDWTNKTSAGQQWALWIGVLLVTAVIIEVCVGIADYKRWVAQQQQTPPPAAPTTAPAAPTPPPGPAPTETRVERSVRVVRAPRATTTRHNYKRAPGPTQSTDNDVVPRKQLVVVTGRGRPTLHTEESNGHRIEDHRSFDRDADGPV